VTLNKGAACGILRKRITGWCSLTTNESEQMATLQACLSRYRRASVARLPEPVADAARRALVDWFAVGIAGSQEAEARALAAMVRLWQTQGQSPAFDGQQLAPVAAALINGAAAHTLDFDDFHIASLLHPGAPTFAAVLALGYAHQLSGARMLASFAAGFEVGASLGLDGVGESLAQQGWHPSSILGHLSAAAGAASVLQLDDAQFTVAMGLAGVQAGGLMAAAGSFAKPFAVGKAAMNGVIAAQLAASGSSAPPGLLDDPSRGLFGTLFQRPCHPDPTNESSWLTAENTFKPYPSCQLTHAAYEAGLQARRVLSGREPQSITLTVHPLAPVIACHTSPRTVLEARFSLPYCVALGLQGRRAVLTEFSQHGLDDRHRRELAARVAVRTDPGVARWSAKIQVEDFSGKAWVAEVPAALGSLDRPMQWDDLEAKFSDAVEPILGSDSRILLDSLKRFDSPGAPEEVAGVLRGMKR
jgi:2-methylcitrate dehydratase PrpD